MEDSYRQPLILELGRCQEGKYDFERRVWEGEEFILERGPQKALVSEDLTKIICSVCRDHMLPLLT